jgi:hypothetical protein
VGAAGGASGDSGIANSRGWAAAGLGARGGGRLARAEGRELCGRGLRAAAESGRGLLRSVWVLWKEKERGVVSQLRVAN